MKRFNCAILPEVFGEKGEQSTDFYGRRDEFQIALEKLAIVLE